MTKEELEKEAREYLRKQTQLNGGGLFHCNILNLILGFAEPREKQIEIDAEQIRALQKYNGALTDKVKELDAQIEAKENEFKYFSNSFSKKIAELEAQIEKMKRCTNCKKFVSGKICKTPCVKYDKWEIGL